MPGPRTYQALGFVTYRVGRFVGRRKLDEALHRAQAQREHRVKVAKTVVVAAVVVSVAARVARSRSQQPTV